MLKAEYERSYQKTTHPMIAAAEAVPQTATRRFGDLVLHSAFQPIFSLSHRRAVGFEALLRPTDNSNQAVSPIACFDQAGQSHRVSELDSMSQALHIQNFAQLSAGDRWLFLNISPAMITERLFEAGQIEQALEQSGFPTHLLVVEILEGAIADEGLLREAVAYFRSIGALVALDDFGAGHSNFDRIWRLAPDIIKLDRTVILEAEHHRSDRLRRMLPNLVSLIHEAGSLVLAEGVETEEQALVAMDADLDFCQGYYFARPEPQLDFDQAHTDGLLEHITTNFATTSIVQERLERQQNAPYISAFRDATAAIEKGATVRDAIQALLGMSRTARFYVLNPWGEEVSHYPGAPRAHHRARQSAPMCNTQGGTWYRRPYFRVAMNEPNRLHTSRPYLSSTGAYMCVTLSIGFGDPLRHVLCCDIDH